MHDRRANDARPLPLRSATSVPPATLNAMSAIGRREIVGLLLFALALAVTISFYLPGLSNDEPSGLSVSDLKSSSTPQGTASGTPMADPGGWRFSYQADDGSGGRAESGPATRLDLAFDEEPSAGLPEDQWILTAQASATLQPGDYQFVIEYRGSIVVRVNGNSLLTTENNGATIAATIVSFQHTRGRVTIEITARDSVGPFVLRWKR